MFRWLRKSRSTSGFGGIPWYCRLGLMDFSNFFIPYVFDVKESVFRSFKSFKEFQKSTAVHIDKSESFKIVKSYTRINTLIRSKKVKSFKSFPMFFQKFQKIFSESEKVSKAHFSKASGKRFRKFQTLKNFKSFSLTANAIKVSKVSKVSNNNKKWWVAKWMAKSDWLLVTLKGQIKVICCKNRLSVRDSAIVTEVHV